MEGFYDICEEGLDVSSEQYEVPGDVGGVEAQWPGPERQGTYLPVDVDLNWVIHETLEMKWKEVWRDYYGQAMLVTLQPKVTLIPRCGPGHRNVRWMVGLKRPGEKWQWLEKGVSGELPPGCREFHNPVVLYRWPELKAPEKPRRRTGCLYYLCHDLGVEPNVRSLRSCGPMSTLDIPTPASLSGC